MHTHLVRAIAGALLLVVGGPATVMAQGFGQPLPQVQPAPQAPLYSPAQLDQLLAPIALYPDQLLAQILMASTYPLEVVQADRWVRDPSNAALHGDQLWAALAPIDWDPSVKSLVPFPQILALMDERLDWLQRLGDAFLAQQADVMDSVQRLRHEALAAGTLRTTPQQTVISSGSTIIIESASPTVVYVPVYNPMVVYGRWPYADYPPFYLAPPSGFYLSSPVAGGIGFSIGFAIVRSLWAWDNWDWGHHRLHVDAKRYNVINNYFIKHHRRPPRTSENWTHDPYHRRGVVYPNPHVQAEFRNVPAGGPESRREFRGFGRNAPPAQATPAFPAPQTRPAVTGRSAERLPAPRTAPQPPSVVEHPAVRPDVRHPSYTTPRSAESYQRPPSVVEPRQQPVRRAPAPKTRSLPTVQRTPAPAFQGGFVNGADVRAQAERGRASLRTEAAKTKPAAVRRSGRPPAAERPKAGPRPAANGGRGMERNPATTGGGKRYERRNPQ